MPTEIAALRVRKRVVGSFETQIVRARKYVTGGRPVRLLVGCDNFLKFSTVERHGNNEQQVVAWHSGRFGSANAHMLTPRS